MNEIEIRLKKVIASCGEDINIDDLIHNTNLIESFRYTSINIIQMIVEIENEFNIEIDDEYLTMDFLSNFSDVLTFVNLKLENLS